MTFSMTGFARTECSGPWGRFSWELRAVNHRYLDVQFKLPEEFRVLEPELRQRLTRSVARGKLECSLRTMADAATDSAPLEIDATRLAALRDALDSLAEQVPTQAPDPLQLLQFPGILRRSAVDPQLAIDAARASFSDLLSAFNEARGAEGAKLRAYLLERADAIDTDVERVRERVPEARGGWLERLRARAAELAVELEPARVEQELVLALQKLDVDEELSRLGVHTGEIRKALAKREPVGRRLDFLVQELNREANTLTSKAQDAEITRLAVDMKVAIEQMREQVQNIE